jgi:hypothetical protein
LAPSFCGCLLKIRRILLFESKAAEEASEKLAQTAYDVLIAGRLFLSVREVLFGEEPLLSLRESARPYIRTSL